MERHGFKILHHQHYLLTYTLLATDYQFGANPSPGEEDVLEEELSSPPSQKTSPSKKEVKPLEVKPPEVKPPEVKPTEVLLKDLQTTVREAKSKIGDLQVLGAHRMSVDVSGVC